MAMSPDPAPDAPLYRIDANELKSYLKTYIQCQISVIADLNEKRAAAAASVKACQDTLYKIEEMEARK